MLYPKLAVLQLHLATYSDWDSDACETTTGTMTASCIMQAQQPHDKRN